MAQLAHIFHGLAVGDALGSPYELRGNHPTLDTQGHVTIQPQGFYQHTHFQGTRRFRPGQVSDDTEMTIALLDSLRWRDHGILTYDKDNAAQSYIDWAATQCPFMGHNTRNHFAGIKTLGGFHARQIRMEAERLAVLSNGALMRCSPLVQLGFQKTTPHSIIANPANVGAMMIAVAEDCRLTNPANECIIANQCYIRMLRALIQAAIARIPGAPLPTRDERLQIIQSAFQEIHQGGMESSPNLRVAFQDAVQSRGRDICENKGFYAHAIYCTVYCILNFDTMTAAFDWIILRPGWHDSDTNAAIAGAAMAAFLGPTKCQSATYDPVYYANSQQVIAPHVMPTDEFMARPNRYSAAIIATHPNVI